MTLNRRSIFSRLFLAAIAGVVTTRTAGGAVSATGQSPTVQKAVYHLSDLGKAAFVIGNIANHIEGKGGPDKVHIVLVVHGKALSYFRKSKASPEDARKLARIAGSGVVLAACGNTMKGEKLEIADLLPGFQVVTEGGVVRIADLQDQGYVYLRP